MVPTAVLMKSGLVSVNTARQVNTAHSKTIVNAARSMSYLSKIAHSTIKRPIHKNTTFKNSNIDQRVNTVSVKPLEYSIVEQDSERNLHIRFSENTPNVVGTQSNGFAGTKASDNADPKSSHDDGSKPLSDDGIRTVTEDPESMLNEETQKGNSCIEGSKLDRGYVGRASTIQVTRSLDFSGFTKWKKRQEGMLCNAFEKLMHEKFRMSSIGKLTFFLGLQVQQKKDGIFISQDIYVVGILKKFGFIEVKTTSTPMETQKPLLKDKDGEEVDVYMYRSMIGSLMYLTSSRPDIMFAVCAYVRYQVNLKVSHLHAMKRIFSDYAGGASLDTEVIQQEVVYILGCRNISSLVQNKRTVVCENTIGNAEYVAALVVVGKCFCDQNQLLDYGTIYAYQDLYWFNNRKAKKSIRLMMETLFGMELELKLVTQS
ncbi:uncharacterized mitochondrial protein-like protein [Tanacetum coccineum]|uniref:Uncharacterized mitochondrial protein-like protein n=1 Tax=Tanacetum coccineum TaxID=301880 RepID=A0ABQ5C7K0_9ASTR